MSVDVPTHGTFRLDGDPAARHDVAWGTDGTVLYFARVLTSKPPAPPHHHKRHWKRMGRRS
jgi:hypothetical protein